MVAKSRVLMLRSGPGGIVELAARTLQAAGKPWLDLSTSSEPLSLEILSAASGGILYCEEIARLTRLQHKNLLFVLDRLEKHNLHLIVATGQELGSLAGQGWDDGAIRRLSEIWLALPALAELRDEIPDIATHLLGQFAESGEAPLRRFATGALNALRQHSWPGVYGELKSAVKSLALAALDDEIDGEDVGCLLFPESAGDRTPAMPGMSPEIMDLPLREAREVFERMYFEYHLRLEGGNMTRLAEKIGLERTHLYRKLKDLGLRAGRREEDTPSA
jgi:DNA-binding NtrC family response regulator